MIKYYKKVLLFVLSLFATSQISIAQKSISSYHEFENYEYKVKQIDEFMVRFNLQKLVIAPQQDSLWRYHNRVLLFDKDYYLANQKIADSLINKVELDSIVLNYKDTTWFAIVKCQILLDNKKDSVTLLLKTQQVQGDEYKWVISDAYGGALELSSKTMSEQFRISPVDNELNFIQLKSLTEDNNKNILQYLGCGYQVDQLTVFNAFVYLGKLKIEYVKELTYCFNVCEGLPFYVKYYNRDSKNAGWLISNIIEKP